MTHIRVDNKADEEGSTSTCLMAFFQGGYTVEKLSKWGLWQILGLGELQDHWGDRQISTGEQQTTEDEFK